MIGSWNDEVYWMKVVLRWALFVFGFGLGLWIVYTNSFTLILLAISFLLSYLLDPLVNKLEKKGLSRTLAVSILLAFFVMVIVSVMLIVIPQLAQQTQLLFTKYQISSSTVDLNPSAKSGSGETYQTNHFLRWVDETVNPLLRELGVNPIEKENIRARLQAVVRWIDSHYPHWSQSIWSFFQSMFTGVASFIVGILNLLLVPVFTFYLLRDYPVLGRSFYAILPPPWRDSVEDWIGDLDQVVGGFIRGQFSIAIILAMINALGLTLIGVPFGFLIGLIAGLANMVPYMSIVIGLVPALIFSFLDQPDLWRLLWVILIFCSAQMLEGLYLGPKIMGKEVGLHPVMIMLAIIIGGSLLGLVGILFAVPLAAILKVVAVRCHQTWKQNWGREAERI